MAETARERLRMHLAHAYTRADDDDAREHIRAAMEACDELSPTPLAECPVCGVVGLPERIIAQDCPETCPHGESWCPGPAADVSEELPCWPCFRDAAPEVVEDGE
jgi:hypothetical protein